jgi:hypothetical protein
LNFLRRATLPEVSNPDDVEDIFANVDADRREGLNGMLGRHGLLLFEAVSPQANPPFWGSSRSIPLVDTLALGADDDRQN